MHRRPTSKDAAATKAAGFSSRYSYISFRIHLGTEHQCEYLAGKDCDGRRRVIFDRDNFKCVDCGRSVNIFTGHLAHGGNTKVTFSLR